MCSSHFTNIPTPTLRKVREGWRGCPILRVFCEGWATVRLHNRLCISRRRCPKRNLSPTLIHAHRPRLVQKVEAITAPAPILRRRRQASLHRIAVHIPQLLHPLLFRPNIEVIEASLPKRRALRSLPKQLDLARIARFNFWQ